MSSYTLCLILCYTEARRGDQKDQRCSVTCDSPAYMICHQTLWSFSLYKPKAEHRMLQDSLICTILHIQGGNQLVTKSMTQLWPHFESWWLFEPTGGSPDVVHLIINASEVSGWLLKASVWLQPKDTFWRRYTILGNFCILWFPSNDLESRIWHCVPLKGFIRQY